MYSQMRETNTDGNKQMIYFSLLSINITHPPMASHIHIHFSTHIRQFSTMDTPNLPSCPAMLIVVLFDASLR
jgi:hypothetical protein